MAKTTVWVKTRGSRGSGTSVHIHTDPACHALTLANSVKQTTREKLPDDWPDCSRCAEPPLRSGGVSHGEDPQARRKHLQQLEVDQLEVFTTP